MQRYASYIPLHFILWQLSFDSKEILKHILFLIVYSGKHGFSHLVVINQFTMIYLHNNIGGTPWHVLQLRL